MFKLAYIVNLNEIPWSSNNYQLLLSIDGVDGEEFSR